jgi:hypothetical protein
VYRTIGELTGKEEASSSKSFRRFLDIQSLMGQRDDLLQPVSATNAKLTQTQSTYEVKIKNLQQSLEKKKMLKPRRWSNSTKMRC